MTPFLVLVHSPLIGPYSVRRTAEALEQRGHRTLVPNLVPGLARSSGFASAFAERLRDAVTESRPSQPLVLVGHSAAGAYLPAIGSALDHKVGAYLFLDARLPRRDASLADQDQPEEVQHRREMARDGILPRWSDWFDPALMEEAIPDREVRDRFLAELKPVPLALFHEPISFESDWADSPCAYLRLSEFYEPLAREASRRGWAVLEVDAGHLHPLTHPGETADLLVDFLERAGIDRRA